MSAKIELSFFTHILLFTKSNRALLIYLSKQDILPQIKHTTNKQIQLVRSLTFAFLITLLFSVEGILVSSAARKEPAVICYRVCQGVGLCVVFFSSIVLSLLYKVCLIGSTLVLGVIGYLVMEVSNNPVTPQENRAFSV